MEDYLRRPLTNRTFWFIPTSFLFRHYLIIIKFLFMLNVLLLTLILYLMGAYFKTLSSPRPERHASFIVQAAPQYCSANRVCRAGEEVQLERPPINSEFQSELEQIFSTTSRPAIDPYFNLACPGRSYVRFCLTQKVDCNITRIDYMNLLTFSCGCLPHTLVLVRIEANNINKEVAMVFQGYRRFDAGKLSDFDVQHLDPLHPLMGVWGRSEEGPGRHYLKYVIHAVKLLNAEVLDGSSYGEDGFYFNFTHFHTLRLIWGGSPSTYRSAVIDHKGFICKISLHRTAGRFSIMLKDVDSCQVKKSAVDVRMADTLKQKKIIFDDTQDMIEKSPSGKLRPSIIAKRLEIKPSLIRPELSGPFLCYWFPVLFGVDEDFIPSSDEEGQFDETLLEELQERANALTDSDLDFLRSGSRIDMTNMQLRALWKEENLPRYAKRKRAKPMLKRDDGVEFECKCDIDLSYSRHYIPSFGGGVKKDGEELKTPHFVGFWEEYRESLKGKDVDKWSDIVAEPPEKDVSEASEGLMFRPAPKFPSSSDREIKNFRLQILKSLRPLSCREIRRFRMPFAEALYLELQEDRYYESAVFFKYLLVKDYMADPKKESALRQSKSSLIKITRFLKLAENFARKHETNREVIALLKSGKYFTEHDENWWWLGEEFYKKAVKSCQDRVLDGGKWEAISRYILGMYYLNCAKQAQLAQEHLSKARELSEGKDWNAELILKRKQEPVSKECSYYLCQALIASSKELRTNGKPNEALPLIHRSYKLCKQYATFQPEVVMETYFELGLTYQALGMLDWAKVAFRKFLEIAKMENLHRSVCDGYLEMALTFRSEDDLSRCRQNLVRYLETAAAYNDENLIAFGNRYLGEYHLSNGYSKMAGEFFTKSFNSFYKQLKDTETLPLDKWEPEHYTLMENLELTRTLVGLAEGEVVTKPICNLILQMKDKKNQKEASLIISWKNKKGTLEDLELKQLIDSKEPSVLSERPEETEEEDEEDDQDEDDDEEPKKRGKRVIRFAPEPEIQTQ